MAKDPALLWYWADWAGGTSTMSRHLKGCYIDLLNAQFNNGKLSLEEIKTVLGSDFGSWPALQKKFQCEKGLYWNERLQAEKDKRVEYTASRRSNRAKKIPHMSPHMENVNINENEINIKEEEEDFNKLDAFKAAFDLYPNKIREGFARNAFFTFSWNKSLFIRFSIAQAKYQKHLANNTWKNPVEFTKFLAEWDQWENYIEPVKESPEFQKKMQQLGVPK